MDAEIIIRPAASQGDYRACQNAQREAWGIVDDSYLLPIATMVGAQLHGGLLLGAFLPDGTAAGFSFAFLGRSEGRICLYSQLTGVIPAYQSKGLGIRLKTTQCEFARAQNIEVIAWAFDPFQSGNARFNLGKLRASAGRYVEDMYGPRNDALNAGVPTDRLIAEWETDPARRPKEVVQSTMGLPRLIVVNDQQSPELALAAVAGPNVLLEIPASLAKLQIQNAALANAWRSAVREGFATAFASGYHATELVREGDELRFFYLLQKKQPRFNS